MGGAVAATGRPGCRHQSSRLAACCSGIEDTLGIGRSHRQGVVPEEPGHRPADSGFITRRPSASRPALLSTWEWAERGEMTLTEAAKVLDRSPLTVLRWIRAGIIPAEQYCKGAPWVIKRRDIEGHDLVERVKTARKGPSSSTPDHPTLIFQ
jgi:excisionase family DNA binding protein